MLGLEAWWLYGGAFTRWADTDRALSLLWEKSMPSRIMCSIVVTTPCRGYWIAVMSVAWVPVLVVTVPNNSLCPAEACSWKESAS